MITAEQLRAVPILQFLTEPEINAILAVCTSSAIMLESTLKKQFDGDLENARKAARESRSDFENRVSNLVLGASGIGAKYDETTLGYIGRVIYELKVKADNGRL